LRLQRSATPRKGRELAQRANDKHAALVSLGRHLGLFTDHVKVDAVYGISEEPMSTDRI
jgi:hypothetical protein